jgi:hypothetical protein
MSKQLSRKQADSNAAFREYVTSTAFALTLSRPQIQLLLALINDDGSRNYLGRFSHYIVSLRCLVDRGLVNLIPKVAKDTDRPQRFRAGTKYNEIEVSPAGLKVGELLELAGFQEDLVYQRGIRSIAR